MSRLFILLAALTALALAGCGAPPPPPEGFTLAVRAMSIDLDVVEHVTISFRPQSGGTFRSGPDQMFEDGAVTLHVESDGTLTMDVSGIYARAHATDLPSGDQQFDLQVWSDDPMMRTTPLVVGTAYRSGDAIGTGMVFLPAWPPPIVASDGGCTGSMCTTQLVITCDMVDRCR